MTVYHALELSLILQVIEFSYKVRAFGFFVLIRQRSKHAIGFFARSFQIGNLTLGLFGLFLQFIRLTVVSFSFLRICCSILRHAFGLFLLPWFKLLLPLQEMQGHQ